ncbi:MOSC domain-containing protein [Microbacteriaceae bacterium VKM Ac-2855]|nr:MOSC domain-containing protein [Microbacteriaceae bacterium VKM Ac-2855]
MHAAVVTGIARYPIKGLSAEELDVVELAAGTGFPGDREWGLARATGRYAGRPEVLSYREFHVLKRDPRLIGLQTQVIDDILRVEVRGHEVLVADLATAEGRTGAGAFFARALDLPAGEEPVLARQAGIRWTDAAPDGGAFMNAVSLINLASVRELEHAAGVVIDPLRFRANIYVDGLPAWAEFDAVGSSWRIGGARVELLSRTERCSATELNRADARRDIAIPRLLKQYFGHAEMGVYAAVREGGGVRIGDPVADVVTDA